MSVAESIVIFFPMLQLGCVTACSTVTSASFSTGQSRNAPPEAVRMILQWRRWQQQQLYVSASTSDEMLFKLLIYRLSSVIALTEERAASFRLAVGPVWIRHIFWIGTISSSHWVNAYRVQQQRSNILHLHLHSLTPDLVCPLYKCKML